MQPLLKLALSCHWGQGSPQLFLHLSDMPALNKEDALHARAVLQPPNQTGSSNANATQNPTSRPHRVRHKAAGQPHLAEDVRTLHCSIAGRIGWAASPISTSLGPTRLLTRPEVLHRDHLHTYRPRSKAVAAHPVSC